MKFAKDKALIFRIICETCYNSAILSLTLILILIFRADRSDDSERYCRTVHCFQKIWLNKRTTQTSTEMGISCQRNGHWAATSHLPGHGLVQRQGGVPEGVVHELGN